MPAEHLNDETSVCLVARAFKCVAIWALRDPQFMEREASWIRTRVAERITAFVEDNCTDFRAVDQPLEPFNLCRREVFSTFAEAAGETGQTIGRCRANKIDQIAIVIGSAKGAFGHRVKGFVSGTQDADQA